MTEAELQHAVVRIIRTHLGTSPALRIVLFGSRATGRHTPRSDYDIGIDAATPIPLDAFARIRADIEALPVLHKIDVVDLCRASAAFREEALAVAKEWSSA